MGPALADGFPAGRLMTAPTFSPHHTGQLTPDTSWRPPLGAEALDELLTKLQSWQPLDGDGLLDDVADALDDLLPCGAGATELARRLHGHLRRLTEIAVAAGVDRRDVYTAGLVERGRALRARDIPGDRTATQHVRRLGWVTNELLDALVAANCLKEVA
jgi:hypothetical protein